MKKTAAGRFFAIILVAALAIVSAPVVARAVGVGGNMDATQPASPRSEAEIDELVESMLARGDYVEGEAVVCYLDRAAGPLGAQSEDPLSGAERLSEVSARQYAEATGEEVPAAPGGGLAPQAEDEPVGIALVRSDMGTAQLLSELLRDPRVLSAEPNYIMTFASEDDETPESLVADEGGSSQSLSSDDAPVPVDQDPVLEEVPDAPDDDTSDVEDVAISAEAEEQLLDQSEPVVSDEQLSSQADHSSSLDLTGFQWFSKGFEGFAPQQLKASNPGVHVPNWNEQGKTNASGVVAILDSGVDYDHPDLNKVMYEFSPELQRELGCGKYGYAPQRDNKKDPMDGLGHGTHVAGIAAAEWNGFGVSGTASGVKIVAVSLARSLDNDLYTTDTIIKGYDFLIRAVEAGVDIRVVNRSLGMAIICNADEAMIRAAGEAGIVTCMASGNNSDDLDAQYEDASVIQSNPYVLRVNASTLMDDCASLSNYGQYTTDLFSPGAAILSTIPTSMESSYRYFPAADDDPLYYVTDFSGVDLDIRGGENLSVNDVSQGEIGIDGDSSSLKVNISAVTESGGYLYIDLPVGNLSKYEVQDISLALNAGILEMGYDISFGVWLGGNSYADSYPSGVTSNNLNTSRYGWCLYALHFTDPSTFEKDFMHFEDSYGNTCIRVRLGLDLNNEAYEPSVDVNADLFIDQIGIGRHNNSGYVPYAYMNGTSMASPCVAGCAAIVSSTLDAASPAERATQTVRLLKGAVRQAAGYQGLCKQNGQVDLRLLGEGEVLAPVIESARVDGKTLVVEGENFTQGGTLLVAGKEVEANPWSEDKIVATLPEGVASGLIPIVVRTSEGAEACRAFIVEVPKEVSISVELYERDLEMFDFSDVGITPTTCPQSLVATDDGTLFAAAEDDGEQRKRANVHHLIRSDDQGVSWTYEGLELPMELKDVNLAYGDGKVFIWGATPAMEYTSVENWHLYSLDVSTCSFEHLRTYEAHGDEVLEEGAIVYVCGDLFFVDGYRDPDDWNGPYNLRIRRFDDQYGLMTEGKLLDHQYTTPDFPPKVAVKGNSIYVYCKGYMGGEETSFDRAMGLERIDVASDSSLSSTDLSAVFSGLKEPPPSDSTCIAVSDEGVFLISSSLEGLLPDGAKRTDTFLLRNGASTFEPYPRRLSFAPFTNPVAVCADGWLYAYGVSQYEDTPVFGRATKVQEEKPDPVDPQPDDSDKDRQPSPLPKTGDVSVASHVVVSLILAGLGCVVLGVRQRRES